MSLKESTLTTAESYPLNPVSLEAIDAWYRSIRPDANIDDVPLLTHIDAIASSVLLSSRETLTADPVARTRAALEMTTMGGNKLTNLIATEGKMAFPLLDLLTELPERKDTPSPNVTLRLLDFGVQIASSLRENPLLTPEEQLTANSKLTNLRLANLHYAQKHVPEQVKGYSDIYITTVRQEAKFASELIKNKPIIPSGAVFEAFIGCMSKYVAWQTENDETVTARHATYREDMPLPKHKGGSGHEVAHDVVVFGPVSRKRLQCKWGPGSSELTSRYDSRVITSIIETSDNGKMSNNTAMARAFDAIATSSRTDSAYECDVMSERYKLDSIVSEVAKPVTRVLSGVAIQASGI
ncbi:MAG: hypothetical protein M3Q36_03190 [bacterium]|nr:hypothetical protein [bacterium]